MRQKKEFFWSLSVSLSPVNLGYQMRQKKKEFFGLSPLCTQKENVRALFVESSGGVRPNEDDDKDKEENG